MENLVFKVKGNNYDIEFPNVGTFRKIEALKQALANGMYSSMVTTNTDSAFHASDMVEIEAILTILAPALINKLECKTFSDLGLEDFNELRKEYTEQFDPWWKGVMKMLSLDE